MHTKILLLAIISVALLLSGCASKGYVDQKMSEMQAKVQADVNGVKTQSAMNAEEIRKIEILTQELSQKTDKALNQTKGFENYQVIWEGTINFDFDSYELNQPTRDNIEGLGQKMIDNPHSILEVAGHADRNGSAKHNFQLGIQRAESVKTYLTDHFGIALYRMFTVSYGKSKPVALPDEKNANARNRRVVLKLWGPLL
ncbi:MAG: OmpA family protein [candidate division Zixibacteria bacterium]|nr:OmpA family protein [candidate division Zixibacteria bacterium]